MGDIMQDVEDLIAENNRLRAEIRTLRNFLRGIKSNVDLALAEYPDVPTGNNP